MTITITFCCREEINTLNSGNDSVLYKKQNALCEDHICPSSVTKWRRLNSLSDLHEVRYRRSTQKVLELALVSWKSAHWIILYRGIIKFCTLTSHIPRPTCMKFGTLDVHSMSRSYEFCQTRTLLKGVREILSVFVHFLSDLDKMWYWGRSHQLIDLVWVPWKSAQWKPYFT
jgi:hypothetical protein